MLEKEIVLDALLKTDWRAGRELSSEHGDHLEGWCNILGDKWIVGWN